jgi:hypothetical protein
MAIAAGAVCTAVLVGLAVVRNWQASYWRAYAQPRHRRSNADPDRCDGIAATKSTGNG